MKVARLLPFRDPANFSSRFRPALFTTIICPPCPPSQSLTRLHPQVTPLTEGRNVPPSTVGRIQVQVVYSKCIASGRGMGMATANAPPTSRLFHCPGYLFPILGVLTCALSRHLLLHPHNPIPHSDKGSAYGLRLSLSHRSASDAGISHMNPCFSPRILPRMRRYRIHDWLTPAFSASSVTV